MDFDNVQDYKALHRADQALSDSILAATPTYDRVPRGSKPVNAKITKPSKWDYFAAGVSVTKSLM